MEEIIIKEKISYLKHITTIMVAVSTTIFAGIISLYYKNSFDLIMLSGVIFAVGLSIETARTQIKINKLFKKLENLQ